MSTVSYDKGVIRWRVIADGKPKLVRLFDVGVSVLHRPMRLVTSTGALTPDEYGTSQGEGFVYVLDVVNDYPGRSEYSLEFYAANSTSVPGVVLELGNRYYIETVADETATAEGQYMNVVANGLIDDVTISPASNVGHYFRLVKGYARIDQDGNPVYYAEVEYTGVPFTVA